MTPTVPDVKPELGIFALEEYFTRKFQDYLELSEVPPTPTLEKIRLILQQIEQSTGVKPVLTYVTFLPEGEALNAPVESQLQLDGKRKVSDRDSLSLVMVTAEGEPVYKRLSEATRPRVMEVAQRFRERLSNPTERLSTSYLEPAQQLYKWLIAPLEDDLKARGIQNMVFVMDDGLRTLPVAALHDGHEFLVEKYSLGLIPSLNLTNTRYESIKDMKVLAMGASKFADQVPLPTVPVELEAIANHYWRGELFLNEAFTLNNLKSQQASHPFGIIHLATHADFQPGEAKNSYIQLWDTKLRLDQLRQMGWHDPPVELLVLSACRTAVGNSQAELGFAGLAVQAGVKSALASLWYVSDKGTLGLMSEFYQQLGRVPVKAEALRQAQIAMIKKQVTMRQGYLVSSAGKLPLPLDLPEANINLSHPYYWAAFTIVGSPW